MKRRDFGMAFLGAGAGIAGCSGPVQSLVVPQADAARVDDGERAPHLGSIQYVRVHGLSIGGSFDLSLHPQQKNYWKAKNSAPQVAKVDEAFLGEHSSFYVRAVGSGSAQLEVTGAGGESFNVGLRVD